jgi:hypothetical protein
VVFSPPNTPVLISGDVVGRGFAVEIEDRGLGLSEERRAELNDLLENPPPFDLSGSDQLGLFVASQLAKKHSIRISLRGSPYGGTTAIVLIPTTLVVSEESYQQNGTDPGTGSGMQLSGRHAARDDTGSLTAVTEEPARPPAGSRVTVAAPDDAAERWPDERWPADSGADPWTAHVAAQTWTAADLAGWAGQGAGGAAETGNGRNGFRGFPDPGDAEAWPAAGDPGRGESPGFREQDDDDGDLPGEDLADADSLPRRVRQASLAPQLRENTLHGRPAANGDSAAAPPAAEERSPEEARSTITAIQQGWERGRSLFDPPEKAPETVTGTQAPAEPSPAEAGEAGHQGDE